MRPCVIVLPEPVIDDDLRLLGRREPLRVENLSAQRAVKPLVVSVLPGRSGIDTDWLDTNSSKPCLHRFGSKLRPVV